MDVVVRVTECRADWRRDFACVICDGKLRVGSRMVFYRESQYGIHDCCSRRAASAFAKALKEH